MKIWKKIKLKNKDKNILLIANALTNYIYSEGPITSMYNKYNINRLDQKKLDLYTTNKIAGLLLLYLIKDTKRINDIANKYNYLINIANINEITPEVEGYITK